MLAPNYLKHVIATITEMGLRPYKELMPMKKSEVDLENALVHIEDSKTASEDVPKVVGGRARV